VLLHELFIASFVVCVVGSSELELGSGFELEFELEFGLEFGLERHCERADANGETQMRM